MKTGERTRSRKPPNSEFNTDRKSLTAENGQHIAAAFLLALASASQACTVPIESSTWGKSDLVAHTATIVLAEFVHSESHDHRRKFVFRTVEVLKGRYPSQFTLELEPAPASYKEVHFSHHEDSEFWNNAYGRLPWVPGPCTPRYAFVEKGQYLLFLESLANGAAAERIQRKDDRWLLYVRTHVKGKL